MSELDELFAAHVADIDSVPLPEMPAVEALLKAVDQ